jgi:hypothetical protein
VFVRCEGNGYFAISVTITSHWSLCFLLPKEVVELSSNCYSANRYEKVIEVYSLDPGIASQLPYRFSIKLLVVSVSGYLK